MHPKDDVAQREAEAEALPTQAQTVVVRTGSPQILHRLEVPVGQSPLKTALYFVRTGSPIPLECGWWLIEQ